MRRLFSVLLLSLFLNTPVVWAQITVPHSFTNFTLIDADQWNANFDAFADDALNRTGGTITGNILMNSGVTLDGADLSAYLTGGRLVASSTAANSVEIAGGITAAGVAIVGTDGKVPALSSTYISSLSGANLTALSAAQLTGTIPSAVQDVITRVGTIASGTWSATLGSISGENLTDLDADAFTSGTIASLRLGTGSPSSSTILRGDGAWTTLDGSSVPANMMMFSSTSCPTGFSEFTSARGRMIVGLVSGGTNQGTVGTGFSNQENRTHSHSIPSLGIDGLSDTTSSNGQHGHTLTTSGPSSTTSAHVLSPPLEAVVAGSTHSHTSSTDLNGAHTHTFTTEDGSSDAGTSGTQTVSTVIPYIQLRLCRKT